MAIPKPAATKTDAAQLRALRRLAQSASARLVGRGGKSIAVPADLRSLLVEISRHLEAGKPVSVVAGHPALSTQQAADLLNVSRPFLVRLLEDGKLPFHRAGSHRRVYLPDLLAFKAQRDRARHSAIRRLAREDVEAGVYDTVILPKGARDE